MLFCAAIKMTVETALYTSEYKIARLPKQIFILLWKNYINAKRNKIGSILEFICPFIFISFLLVIRSFIEELKLTCEYNRPSSVLDVRLGNSNHSRNLVAYYPNTEFVRGLVENAVDLVVANNQDFNPTSLSKIFVSLRGNVQPFDLIKSMFFLLL